MPCRNPRFHSQKKANIVIAFLREHGTNKAIQNDTFLALVRDFSREQREYIASLSGNTVIYLGDEVRLVQQAEQAAVLKAAPLDNLAILNGLNIGAGGRPIAPSLLGIDVHRGLPDDPQLPKNQITPQNTILSWADSLPFKRNSIDFIVSLHNLEHLEDPVAAVLRYLRILKPGGGLGVVIPHWKYAWDARNDKNAWGHRWNSAPEVVCELYYKHWKELSILEHLHSYPYRLSFDFVLRKKGTFLPFEEVPPTYPTGHTLHCQGRFLGSRNMRNITNQCE